MRLLKGLFKLAVLAGIGWVVYRLMTERRSTPTPLTSMAPAVEVPTPAPTRRPGAGRAPGGASRPGSRPESTKGPAWVEPVEGACPDSHPVKANMTSGIFHVPGGRHYERTIPDRCYRDAAAAEADGLRQSKQ